MKKNKFPQKYKLDGTLNLWADLCKAQLGTVNGIYKRTIQ